MIMQKSVKPATAATVNGLQEIDQLGRRISVKAKSFTRISQEIRRYRIIRAHWIVVSLDNGWRRSIPVFIRRPVPITCRNQEVQA
jgi:hypothetical protein